MKRKLLICGLVYGAGICTGLMSGIRHQNKAESRPALVSGVVQDSLSVRMASRNPDAPIDVDRAPRRALRRSSPADDQMQQGNPLPWLTPDPREEPELIEQFDAGPVLVSLETTVEQSALPFADDFGQVRPPQATPPLAFDPCVLDLEGLAPLTPTEEEAKKLQELRETLGALANTKAELLNETALQTEITRLQRKIADLQAARRLLDAQQTLQKVIDEFPESPAAGRAKTMLKSPSVPDLPAPGLAPIPDPVSRFRNAS
jgi:hypothetical protein